MKLNENAYVLASVLLLLWIVRWYCYKHCMIGDLQPQVYFVNGTWMFSCLAEIFLLCLRMLPAGLVGSRDRSASYLQSGSFVLEAAMKCLLPQPLYREHISLMFLLFGVILSYNHGVWTSVDKYLLNYFLAFSLLPKCAWLCIYCLPRPTHSQKQMTITSLAEAAMWSSMVAFLVAWLVYLCRIAALITADYSMFFVGRYSQVPFHILLAILPCRHMVELSDCLQFVLISRRYHRSTKSK